MEGKIWRRNSSNFKITPLSILFVSVYTDNFTYPHKWDTQKISLLRITRPQRHKDMLCFPLILSSLGESKQSKIFFFFFWSTFLCPKGRVEFNGTWQSALRSEEQLYQLEVFHVKSKVVLCPWKRVSVLPFIGLCFETVEKSKPYNLTFLCFGGHLQRFGK